MKTKIGSTLILLLTAMIWGFAFVAQVDGVQYIGSFTLNGLRYVVGIVSLLPVVLFFEREKSSAQERRDTFKASLVTGVLLFAASTSQQLGIEYTASAGLSGFITGPYTVMVPIGCLLIFRSKTPWNVWAGSLFAVLGLFFLCYRPGLGIHFGRGETLLLISAALFAAQIMAVDYFGKGIRSLHFAWGQFAVCAVLGVTTMFLFDTPTVEGILSAKWAILYCGVLSVGVAYTLQIVAQKHADPTMATIVMSTESVFSAVGGVLFGIDQISLLGYGGCALMFCGVILSQLTFPKREKRSSKEIQGE